MRERVDAEKIRGLKCTNVGLNNSQTHDLKNKLEFFLKYS